MIKQRLSSIGNPLELQEQIFQSLNIQILEIALISQFTLFVQTVELIESRNS